MTGRESLAQRLSETCSLEGTFKLRSGIISDHYFDKYLFESDPGLLNEVATNMVTLVPPDIEVLAGLELGGIPVATALSLATGIPAAFVRKRAKEYGTARLAEGASVDNKRLLIVEDVITSGGQVAVSAAALRELGGTVDTVVCVLDRSNGDHRVLDEAELAMRSLFNSTDIGW